MEDKARDREPQEIIELDIKDEQDTRDERNQEMEKELSMINLEIRKQRYCDG